MINVSKFVFNPFQENTYIISDETGECIILDAGNYTDQENNAIVNHIGEKKLKPLMLVNTHGHVDHLLGVQFLREHFGIPFVLHGEDNFLAESASTHGALYGFNISESPVPDMDLRESEDIRFGNTVLDIAHTPGHTPGHICLFHQQSKTLFTGDTLFRESIGRTDLPGGDYSWIMRSILELVIPLGEDVKFHPGHGPESTIGHEVLYNPFITEVINGEINYK